MPASDLAGRSFLMSSSTHNPLTSIFLRFTLTSPVERFSTDNIRKCYRVRLSPWR